MQDPTDNRDVAIAVSPDPLDQLVKRVRVGEDVVGVSQSACSLALPKRATLSAAP
jgi:hypothetical protein